MSRLEIDHPLIGKLSSAGEQWEGETDGLQKLSSCGWNYRHVAEHCQPTYNRNSERIRPPAGEEFAPRTRKPRLEPRQIRLIVESEDGSPPSKLQEQAIDYLFKREHAVLKMIVASVRKRVVESDYWRCLRDTLEDGFPKLEKLLARDDGWLSLIEFREIRVSDKTRKGKIVIGCDCNCAWDGEHGLGVQLVEGRVIEIGEGSIGWSIHKERNSIEHPRLGELKERSPYWDARSSQLHRFSQCGWNMHQVREQLIRLRRKRARPLKKGELALVDPPPEQMSYPSLRILFISESGPPTKAQFEAVDQIFEREADVLDRIGRAVAKYVKGTEYWTEMKEKLGDGFPDLERLVANDSGWLSLIKFSDVRISDKLHRGNSIVGCLCDCAWTKHLGVQFCSCRVLRVGEAEVAWTF